MDKYNMATLGFAEPLRASAIAQYTDLEAVRSEPA